MSLADFLGIVGSSLNPSLTAGLVGSQVDANPGATLGKLFGIPDFLGPSRSRKMAEEAATQGIPGFNRDAPATARWEVPSDAGPMNVPGAMGRPHHASIPGVIRQAMDSAPPEKEHSGLRKLLGNVGDALLVGSGAAPIYAPSQERKRLGNAVAAFLGQDRLAEIARMNPALAVELREQDIDYRGKALKNDRDVQEAAMQYLGAAQDQMSYDRARAAIAGLYGRYGLNVDELGLPRVYSPQAINELRLRGTSSKDQLGDARMNRRLDWDIEDDEIDNARMDRNTDSLVETREGRLSEYERNNRERIATSRRGQDLTDRRARTRPAKSAKPRKARPTATDNKGRKVEWDGKAWVPVR